MENVNEISCNEPWVIAICKLLSELIINMNVTCWESRAQTRISVEGGNIKFHSLESRKCRVEYIEYWRFGLSGAFGKKVDKNGNADRIMHTSKE